MSVSLGRVARTTATQTASFTPTGWSTASGSAILDVVPILSQRLGRNLPALAVYDVTKIRLTAFPVMPPQVDNGLEVTFSLNMCEPTAARVAALKWAAKDFFADRKADSAMGALQFYPRLFPVAAAAADNALTPWLSRQGDTLSALEPTKGRLYTMTGSTDTNHFGIFSEWGLQHPVRPQLPTRTGAEIQQQRLYDDAIEATLESVSFGKVGYSFTVGNVTSDNATGETANGGVTQVASAGTENFAEYSHTIRYKVHELSWELNSGPLRSYPVLCGQMMFSFFQVWPARLSGTTMGGDESFDVIADVELVGWHELR